MWQDYTYVRGDQPSPDVKIKITKIPNSEENQHFRTNYKNQLKSAKLITTIQSTIRHMYTTEITRSFS